MFPTVWTPVPAVSWPWVPACGSLEPPRRDGENAQKTGKNGGKMGEIQPKKCGRSGANQGSTGSGRGAATAARLSEHREWWTRFWHEGSSVDLGPNQTALEAFYYGMQYQLGSGARAGNTAPGLYGPWQTVGPFSRHDFRRAARTLFNRLCLAHFCSCFRHFFDVFSVLAVSGLSSGRRARSWG